MLQDEYLKIGTCIISQKLEEGVIVAEYHFQNDVTYEVLFMVNNNTHYFSNTKIISSKDLKANYNLAYFPHFCRIDYLYSILQKYSNNKFVFLGLCDYKSKWNNSYTQYLYLLTIRKTFLEIIICNRIQKEKEPFIWINEYNFVEDLYLNDTSYLFINKEVTLFNIEEIDCYKDKIFGIYFSDKNQNEIAIGKNKTLYGSKINGLLNFFKTNLVLTKKEFLDTIKKQYKI